VYNPACAHAPCAPACSVIAIDGLHVIADGHRGVVVLVVESDPSPGHRPGLSVLGRHRGRRVHWSKRLWRACRVVCPIRSSCEAHELAQPRANAGRPCVACAVGLLCADATVAALAAPDGSAPAEHTALDPLREDANAIRDELPDAVARLRPRSKPSESAGWNALDECPPGPPTGRPTPTGCSTLQHLPSVPEIAPAPPCKRGVSNTWATSTPAESATVAGEALNPIIETTRRPAHGFRDFTNHRSGFGPPPGHKPDEPRHPAP
jgi:hypothetical protein